MGLIFSKDKITITISNEDDPKATEDFWNIIMFALDWDSRAKHSKEVIPTMTDDQRKMAEKLEELSRPIYG